MKKFLYWNAPERGIVFALALLLFGSWSLWSILILSGGLSPVFMGLIACGFEGTSLADKIPWQSLLFALPLLFLFYFLIQLIHVIIFYRKQLLKQWKWFPVLFVCMALCGIGTILLFLLIHSWCTIFSHYGDTSMFFSTPPSPLWLYAGCCAAWGVFLTVSKIAANLASCRWYNVYGRGTICVLILFGLTYLVSVILAVNSSCKTEKTAEEVGRFFGKPLTAEALKNDYYRGHQADENFWKKVSVLRDTVKNELPEEISFKFSSGAEDFSAAELRTIENILGKSKSFAQWQQMFSQELPVLKRDYSTGKLSFLRMPEFVLLRDFCRLELIQIRLAILHKNKKQAMISIERMNYVYQHLSRDKILISGLVLIAIEKIRLAGVEQLLNSGFLTAEELFKFKADIEKRLADFPEFHRQYIHGEGTFTTDVTQMIAHGQNVKLSEDEPDNFIPAMYPYRWLAPAVWYTMTRNRETLIKVYKVNDLTEVNDLHDQFAAHTILARMLLPSLPSAGKRFHELEMAYRIIKTILELKYSQLQNGKFPEKIDLPVDWFSKQKCHYVIDRKKGTIKIWSVGRNLKNDEGVSDKSGKDDIIYSVAGAEK